MPTKKAGADLFLPEPVFDFAISGRMASGYDWIAGSEPTDFGPRPGSEARNNEDTEHCHAQKGVEEPSE